MRRKANVLFFSTGDATRSRMAAAFFKRITDEVETASTAVKSVAANGLAEEVMKEIGVDLAKQPAKSVAQSFHENFAFVVTLSDDSKERSPVWPFTRNLVHWNMPDPAAVDGPIEKRREAFRRVRDEIRNRAAEFAQKIHPNLKPQSRAATA
jgi:arsenate reductase (thioredoxin)